MIFKMKKPRIRIKCGMWCFYFTPTSKHPFAVVRPWGLRP